MFDFVHISDLTGDASREDEGDMKAVVIRQHGKVELMDVKKPQVRDGYVRVKTIAVAVSSNDLQVFTRRGAVGSIFGSDFAGIVESVGRNCKSGVKPGDKIYGTCHGIDRRIGENGAFAEYVMVKDGNFARLVEGSMSFEEAATLGMSITIVGQALYTSLKLPLPTEPTQTPFPILISGGSTTIGTLAIQYAKLSGLQVIATSSPKNFDLLRSRGADAVFDYHDLQSALHIKQYAQNRLHHILDCVATPGSSAMCAASFPSASNEELHFVSLRPLENWTRRDVNPIVIQAQTAANEQFSRAERRVPATREQVEFQLAFWEMSGQLVAAGKITSHPVTLREGGLEAVADAITEVSISGSRLVFNVK